MSLRTSSPKSSPKSSLAFVLATLVVVGASACNTTIDPADYDATCSVDTDCVMVVGGDVCGSCPADIGAVSVDGADEFQADYDAISGTCAPWSARNYVSCDLAFPAVEAACDAGTCILRDIGGAEDQAS